MSHVHRAVGWSPQKRKYDLVIALAVTAYAATFAAVTGASQPHVTAETVLLRATGSLAFLMLSFALMVGPLARLSPRFLPLLYNRRHLGVATFLVALAHGAFAVFQFHFLGDLNPFASVLSSDGSFGGGVGVPFQPLGAIALAVLFAMAATSHDFWLAVLTPRVWKGLHMAVYAAYALLLGHIVLGALQGEAKAYLWPMVAAVAGAVLALQLYTGLAERRRDRAGDAAEAGPDGYVRAVAVSDLADQEGRTVALGDERVAVFRNGSVISCVSNVCRHQMGPIGEGRIVDGCIVCPWHGFQYDPVTGRAPPPFDERLETYDVAVRDGFVWVNPAPGPPGAASRTARVPAADDANAPAADDANANGRARVSFYVGYRDPAPPPLRRFQRLLAGAVLAAAVASAVVVALGQRRLPDAAFEFGQVRSFEGLVVADPYPSLIVPQGAASVRRLLSGPGKSGADELVASVAGGWATLDGTLIRRGGQEMIQVEPGSVAALDRPEYPYAPPDEPLGTHYVEGEIVGSKCWLGVMNPGGGIAHRACATVCMLGGVPPLLSVRRADGRTEGIVLAGPRGEAIGQRLSALVAAPVGMTGRLVRRGSTTLLYVDPDDIRRLQ